MFGPYARLPRAVHILCLGTFINRAGTFLIPFLTLYLTTRRGFSEVAATGAAAVVGVGSMTATLIGGHLADQVGRRRVMLLSLIGNAGVLMVFGYLQSPWTIIPCLYVFTLLADMYRPAASAMMADLVEPERRSLSFGLMYTAINLGFAVGALGGGFISKRAGFHALFYIDSGTSVLYAAIIAVFIRETLGWVRPRHGPSAHPAADCDPRAGATGSPAALGPAVESAAGSPRVLDAAAPPDRSEDRIPFGVAMARIFRDKVFIGFCLAQVCLATVFMQSMTSLPLFLRRFGIDTEGYGKIIAVNGLLIAALQLPLTALVVRFNRARVLVIGTAMTAIGFGATELAARPLGFACTVVIWTIGEMMMAPFNGPIVTDLAPPALRARYFGVFGLSFSFSMTISAPLGGWILQRFGGIALTRACMGIGLVGVVILVSMYRQLQPKKKGVEGVS